MSITALKTLSLILMTIDHIGAFIPEMPIAFRWIGRLSAPVFLFCLLEGIKKTSSRKKYILRLYLFSIGMAGMDIAVNLLMPEQPLITDNIFLVYFAIAACVAILDWSREKYHSLKRGILYIVLWQILAFILLFFYDLIPILPSINRYGIEILFRALTGFVGGWRTNTILVILGVMLYYLKGNRKKFVITYLTFSFVPSILIQISFFPILMGRLEYILKYIVELPEIPEVIFCNILKAFITLFLGFDTVFIEDYSLLALLYDNYQWMMAGALPIFMLYNGTRGKGYKYFYYLYYMLHILALAFLRQFLSASL